MNAQIPFAMKVLSETASKLSRTDVIRLTCYLDARERGADADAAIDEASRVARFIEAEPAFKAVRGGNVWEIDGALHDPLFTRDPRTGLYPWSLSEETKEALRESNSQPVFDSDDAQGRPVTTMRERLDMHEWSEVGEGYPTCTRCGVTIEQVEDGLVTECQGTDDERPCDTEQPEAPAPDSPTEEPAPEAPQEAPEPTQEASEPEPEVQPASDGDAIAHGFDKVPADEAIMLVLQDAGHPVDADTLTKLAAGRADASQVEIMRTIAKLRDARKIRLISKPDSFVPDYALPEAEEENAVALRIERTRGLILEALAEGPIAPGKIAARLWQESEQEITAAMVSKALSDLADEGRVVADGAGRSRTYALPAEPEDESDAAAAEEPEPAEEEDDDDGPFAADDDDGQDDSEESDDSSAGEPASRSEPEPVLTGPKPVGAAFEAFVEVAETVAVRPLPGKSIAGRMKQSQIDSLRSLWRAHRRPVPTEKLAKQFKCSVADLYATARELGLGERPAQGHEVQRQSRCKGLPVDPEQVKSFLAKKGITRVPAVERKPGPAPVQPSGSY